MTPPAFFVFFSVSGLFNESYLKSLFIMRRLALSSLWDSRAKFDFEGTRDEIRIDYRLRARLPVPRNSSARFALYTYFHPFRSTCLGFLGFIPFHSVLSLLIPMILPKARAYFSGNNGFIFGLFLEI